MRVTLKPLIQAWFIWLILSVLSPTPLLARSVSLAWDPNPEPDIAGYKVYYRSGDTALPFNGTGAAQGSSPVDVGKNLAVTLTNLPDSLTWHFAVTAYNSAGYESSLSNIVSSPPPTVTINRPPAFASISPRTIAEGSSLSFQISATDPDGDPIAYSATNLPAGAVFTASTRTFSWTPGYEQAGSYSVSFQASDGKASASLSVSITVTDVNRPPLFPSPGSRSVSCQR